MKIDKTSLELSLPTDDLLTKVASGKAILFAGAGFSVKTRNLYEDEASLAASLAKEICELGRFEQNTNLKFVADYFIEKNDKQDLINFLKKKYTIKSVDDIHRTICNINWRRFYTTNYDQTIEIASADNKKVVDCVDISFPVNEYYKKEKICVHLNGSVNSLNEDTLENSFKLSSSSYMSAESFTKSDWSYYFKKDLERCSAIVFVGYSMYDIEIEKILYENPHFKDKVFFITSTNPSMETEFTLSKYGTILPLGTEGFAELLIQNGELFNEDNSEYELRALIEYQLSETDKEIRESDIERMLFYGDLDESLLQNAVLGEQEVPFMIVRNQLEEIVEFIKNGENIVICSEMGNGKSILMTQIATSLVVDSFQCFLIHDYDADYIGDIDELSKLGRKIVLFIDGYDKYIDLLKHYSLSLPKNITIVACARTMIHERLIREFSNTALDFREIYIDSLSNVEKEFLIDIIDNLGFWGDKASLSLRAKLDKVTNLYKSQISLVLLSIFDAPQMKERISSALNLSKIEPKVKDTIFAISLLDILDLPLNFSLIADISGNEKIYSSKLLNDSNFKQLFKQLGNRIQSKSSLFSLFLIKNHMNDSYVIEKLVEIARRLNNVSSKDYLQNEVFIEIRRFSFVERLMPEKNRKNNLKNYYEDLKNNVKWLKSAPHFWLQYAMAHIAFEEFPRSQTLLDTAYSLAEKKPNYDTRYIDSQQSRLYLLMAVKGDTLDRFKLFYKGDQVRHGLPNDSYKFKEVHRYKDFFDKHYSSLSKKDKVTFEHICKNILKELEIAISRKEVDVIKTPIVQKSKDSLEEVIALLSK